VTYPIKIAVASDLHWHHYSNGLTIDDVTRVGDEFVELCKSADMVILCGDFTLSRNPMYEVLLAITNFLKKLNAIGIPVAILVGNHDRIYKSDHKLHSLEHIKLYPYDYPNVEVMDHRLSYDFQTRNGSVRVHAVPAGHTPKDFDISKTSLNICVFHDITMGSLFHNGPPAEKGLSVSLFDEKGFDLVLAGDNHKHQQIAGLEACQGQYVGAGLQHNWGDADDVRGFVCIEATDGHPWQVECKFVPSRHPKFKKVTWSINNTEELIAAVGSIDDWRSNIIRLIICGPADVLNDVDVNLLKMKLKEFSGASHVDVKLRYDTVLLAKPEVLSDADDWNRFLMTRLQSLENIDMKVLESLGNHYIREVS
jgi:DNA repair exonuclease SbcCD nuclease subunit